MNTIWRMVKAVGTLLFCVAAPVLAIGAAIKIAEVVVRPAQAHVGPALEIYTDSQSGCEYIRPAGTAGSGSSITPRMGANGKQICGAVK